MTLGTSYPALIEPRADYDSITGFLSPTHPTTTDKASSSYQLAVLERTELPKAGKHAQEKGKDGLPPTLLLHRSIPLARYLLIQIPVQLLLFVHNPDKLTSPFVTTIATLVSQQINRHGRQRDTYGPEGRPEPTRRSTIRFTRMSTTDLLPIRVTDNGIEQMASRW